MEAALDIVGPVLAASTLAVAALILVLARRSASAVFLSVFLASWGAIGLSGPAVRALGGDTADVVRGVWSLHWLTVAGILSFAIVYPNVNVTRVRKAAIAGVFATAAAGALTLALLPDRLFFDPATGARPIVPIVGAISGVATYPVAMALLGRRWFTSAPSTYRTQLAWGMIPIAWWTLHDGLGYFVYPFVFGGEGVRPTLHPWLLAPSLLVVASVLYTLSIMGTAVWRTLRGRGAGDDRALGFVLLYALPFTLIQVLEPGPGARWHILLDYAVVPLAVYGVLRHRVVDIDLKIKRGIQHSTIAAVFLTVFFVAATVAQEFLAESLGWLAGGAAAGLLLVGLAPLQRVAERLSAAALPHAREDAGYLTYRRYQIYRVALEGTLRDGVVQPGETAALRSLREELGLTMDDHAQLERDARARLRAQVDERAHAGPAP